MPRSNDPEFADLDLHTVLNLSPEDLGRVVQTAWRDLALDMPNAPDSWKRSYDEVTPQMKEQDNFIGMRVLKLIETTLSETYVLVPISAILNSDAH